MRRRKKTSSVEEISSFCERHSGIFRNEICNAIRPLKRDVFSIVGAHGVGKTTLVHKLCNAIYCSSALNEVVRDVPFCDEIHDSQTMRATEWIFCEHIRRLTEILHANRDAKSHIVICDRSEYDSLLYYLSDSADFVIAVNVFSKLTQNEQSEKPYKHHIILFDDEQSHDECDKFRNTDSEYFVRKRMLFYNFFTVSFNDVFVVSRNTAFDEVISWMQQRSQFQLIE